MDKQISWHAELGIKSGQLDALKALTNEMVESTRFEPGVLIYERFISEDGHTLQVFERYTDSAAAIEHLMAFEEKYGDRFAAVVDRKRFTVLGTPSFELRSRLDRFGATYFAPCSGFSRT